MSPVKFQLQIDKFWAWINKDANFQGFSGFCQKAAFHPVSTELSSFVSQARVIAQKGDKMNKARV